MKIEFTTEMSVVDSMVFESCYEKPLQMELEEKRELLGPATIAVWMRVDGRLAGEAYGVPLHSLDEDEDCDQEPKDSIYCYSTTVLPEYQGKGLGKLLKAFWLGRCFPKTVVGRSTSPAMKHLNPFWCRPTEHASWYQTPRTAWFYRLCFEQGSHRWFLDRKARLPWRPVN